MLTINELSDFINKLPKAELHIHIEGSLEPELMFEIAERNGLKIKYNSVDELKQAYMFSNLQEFLDIYYEGASVLITEKDFFDMTWAYLQKAASENVMHTEIFFDPQTHTLRGIPFSTVVNGINNAMAEAKEKLGVSSKLIMCILRHLDEDSAMTVLQSATDHKHQIIAVGLDSSEVGNPPAKFERVFAKAREHGFLTVAHAGEEGPSEYVRQALDLLMVSRIDHGNRAMEDEILVKELSGSKMPLTVCPLSNLKLRVVETLAQHPLKKMLDNDLLVTINSDDPAYFGGHINENYIQTALALNLSKEEIYTIARNSFLASFLDEQTKTEFISKLDEYYESN
jgi:adenosine deaminase